MSDKKDIPKTEKFEDSILISDINKIPKKKVYTTEELIIQKRPYYPIYILFLYKINKIMNISLESDLKKNMNESNMTKIKEYMDFCLLIREENQEIVEEQNLIKYLYTGNIFLLNLTINKGTYDMSLKYNDELHQFINSSNIESKRNLRTLDENTDSLRINDEKEICFVKINFYENGNSKDIFYPEGFDIENMIYINKIAEFILPKLSKNLYTENFKEKITQIDKIFQETTGEEEEEESKENYVIEEEKDLEKVYENSEGNLDENSGLIFIDDKNNETLLRRNSENDLYSINDASKFIENMDFIEVSETNYIIDNSDFINNDNNDIEYKPLNEDDFDIDNTNSSLNNDSLKYYLKGI